MRKKHFLICFVVLLSLCIIGCSNVKEKGITEEKKEKVVEDFLKEVFHLNNEERYTILMDNLVKNNSLEKETVDFQEFSEKQQLAYNEYYKNFEGMVTESCIDSMIKNRYPMQYEKLLIEAGEVVEIDNIHFEAIDEDTYTYEVSFKENEMFESTIKGSVILLIENNQVLVDVFVIY